MNSRANSAAHHDMVWDSRTLLVRACSVSTMDNNVYVLTCVTTGDQALIDAADDAPAIRRLLGTGGNRVRAIITTHRHWDHHRALAELVADTGATTYAGAPDADQLPVPTDVPVQHGDLVRVGEVDLTIVALRGHTPGSIAIAAPGGDQANTTVLFTGDSLFPGGPGKTGSAKDFTSLMDDVDARVFGVFPDSTRILPGHGAGTTVGEQRPQRQQWRQRGW